MNSMKEVKIIQSKTEPNKNHLWLSVEGLKQFKGDGWGQVVNNDNKGGNSNIGGGNSAVFIHISNAVIEQLPEEYLNMLLNINKEAYNLCYNYTLRTMNLDYTNPPTIFYNQDGFMLPVVYGMPEGENYIPMIVYNLNFTNDDIMIVKYKLYSDGHTELIQG